MIFFYLCSLIARKDYQRTEIARLFRVRGQQQVAPNIKLDPKTKKQVVMIFKEAMNNCAKYSECTDVSLNIECAERFTNITLVDNGKGFDVDKKSKGRGLKNIVDRSKKIGALVAISSNSEGTSIRLDRIPHMSEEINAKDS